MIYILIVFFFLIVELFLFLLIKKIRSEFQWLITEEDEFPILDKNGLEKFFRDGFDPELGWVRKPDTMHQEKGKYGKTEYHIGPDGCRFNPNSQLNTNISIGCFGDSFCFCRQVNDDETWQCYLEKSTACSVKNFGVGNYGADQAVIRMNRELTKNKFDICILAVVPSTIVRILCVWKHYNEFGNTFGFKPRFDCIDNKTIIIPNIIDSEEKFFRYRDFIEDIRKYDYFYESKFRNEMLRFPFIFSILRNSKRNIPLLLALILRKTFSSIGIASSYLEKYPMEKIMSVNLDLRTGLFSNDYAVSIFEAIIKEFKRLSSEYSFKPVFLLMPQKDDIIFMRKNGFYYADCLTRIRKIVDAFDLGEKLIDAQNLDDLFSDDSVYGGHLSRHGNELAADFICAKLREKKII